MRSAPVRRGSAHESCSTNSRRSPRASDAHVRGATCRCAFTAIGWRRPSHVIATSRSPARPPMPPRKASRAMSDLDDMPPVAALFPSQDERVRLDDYLTRELLCANERIANGSVVPTIDMEDFRAQLEGFDFEAPAPLQDLLRWTMAQLEHGVVHM